MYRKRKTPSPSRNGGRQNRHARAHRLEGILPEGRQRIQCVGYGCATAENHHDGQEYRCRAHAGKQGWNYKGNGQQAIRDTEMFGQGCGDIRSKQQINDEKQDTLRKFDADPKREQREKSHSRSVDQGNNQSGCEYPRVIGGQEDFQQMLEGTNRGTPKRNFQRMD